MPISYRHRQNITSRNAWIETFQHTRQTVLEGQDAVYGDPGQVPTFGVTERYRSLGRERLLQYHTWPSVDPVLAGQDAIYGGPGQVPGIEHIDRAIYPRPPHQDWQHSYAALRQALEIPPGLNGALQYPLTMDYPLRPRPFHQDWQDWGSNTTLPSPSIPPGLNGVLQYPLVHDRPLRHRPPHQDWQTWSMNELLSPPVVVNIPPGLNGSLWPPLSTDYLWRRLPTRWDWWQRGIIVEQGAGVLVFLPARAFSTALRPRSLEAILPERGFEGELREGGRMRG